MYSYAYNPFVPTVPICDVRDAGAPLKPLRDDSVQQEMPLGTHTHYVLLLQWSYFTSLSGTTPF